MKSVYSSRGNVYGLWLGIVLFAILLLCSLGFMLSNMNQNNIVIVSVILITSYASIIAFFIIALNREGCTITYDRDKNMLYRKGYIHGYESQISVEEITEIIIVQLPKEKSYYVFVDPSHTKYFGFYKKSFFKIERTKKHQEFIEQFWDKEINECKNYVDLIKQK